MVYSASLEVPPSAENHGKMTSKAEKPADFDAVCDPSASELWESVLESLRATLPEFAFESWLLPLRAENNADVLTLLCPSSFHCERIRKHYLDQIQHTVTLQNAKPLTVALAVQKAKVASQIQRAAAEPATQPAAPAPTEKSSQSAKRNSQFSFAYSFETFLGGPCNALAREAAISIAQGKQFGVSPLYLLSGGGLGKTHLARAVVGEARRSKLGTAVYTSAENFTSEFLSSVRDKSGKSGMREFKRRFRENCDLLVVEDIQFLGGKTATQLEIFHTIEHLLDAGCRVMLTADRMPREIPNLDPRLASRITSGLVAEIEAPDAQLRRRILRAKAAAGGVHLPTECLDLIVENARGSVRDLEGVLVQLVASAALLKQPIDLELTKAALRKLAAPDQAMRTTKKLEIRSVVSVVTAFFQTPLATLATQSRRKDVCVPRQLAMYLCRQYTDASLQEIGKVFGRNHSAVTNAVEKTEREILANAPLRYQIEAITEKLDRIRDRNR